MVIRGEGQLKKAMTIIASGAILNIILDPIFITVLKPYGLGIEAAAYATVFSQFVQAVITLWYFRKKSPNVKIGRIRIDGELLPQVLSVGVSALLMQILTLVQQTVIYRVAANYGGENSQILLGAASSGSGISLLFHYGESVRDSSQRQERIMVQRNMTG